MPNPPEKLAEALGYAPADPEGLGAPWSLSSAQPPYRSIALLVVAAGTLMHLWAAAGLKLSVDEAHYALYGLHPDWSYYDHPPMVGWLQWLALRLGDSELALRLWPIVGYVLISLLLWKLARRAAIETQAPPEKAGCLAVLLAAGMPAVQFLGIGLVPDLPLAICALCLAWPIERLSRESDRRSRLRDWLWVGLLIGLAGLSKYTAVLLPLGLLAFVAWERRWRWLSEPGPWLAAAVALCLVAPVLYWNVQHRWSSFSYQSAHVESGQWGLGNVLIFILGQAIAYSLIMTVSVWKPALAARTSPTRLLVSLAMPILLAGLISGATPSSLPHWTFAGWLLLVPLAACRLGAARPSRSTRVCAGVSGVASVVIIGALTVLLVFRPVERVPAIAPAVEGLVGWDEAAQRASRLRDRYFPDDPRATLMVNNWTYASRLAWYARPAPVQLNDSRRSQFDFWFGKPSGPGILVVPVARGAQLNLKLATPMRCSFIDQMNTGPARDPLNRFLFFRCYPFDAAG